MGLLKWLAALFGSKSNIQFGKGNQSAQTDNGGSVQQAITETVLGNQFIIHGMSREDVASIVREELARQRPEPTVQHDMVEELVEPVANAIRRVDKSQRRGKPEAEKVIAELKESGDTAGLLEFLQAQKQEAVGDMVGLNREIAAVAYLRGEIDIAERALQDILRVLPDDLGALNSMGHVHLTRGRLDKAMANYARVLDLATEQEDQAGQAVAYGNLGIIYKTRGDLDEAERMHRKSLKISERLGRQEGMANQYGNLGAIYETRGDGKRAREYWIKSRDLYARIGVPHMVRKVQGWIDKLDASEESGEK